MFEAVGGALLLHPFGTNVLPGRPSAPSGGMPRPGAETRQSAWPCRAFVVKYNTLALLHVVTMYHNPVGILTFMLAVLLAFCKWTGLREAGGRRVVIATRLVVAIHQA